MSFHRNFESRPNTVQYVQCHLLFPLSLGLAKYNPHKKKNIEQPWKLKAPYYFINDIIITIYLLSRYYYHNLFIDTLKFISNFITHLNINLSLDLLFTHRSTVDNWWKSKMVVR